MDVNWLFVGLLPVEQTREEETCPVEGAFKREIQEGLFDNTHWQENSGFKVDRVAEHL